MAAAVSRFTRARYEASPFLIWRQKLPVTASTGIVHATKFARLRCEPLKSVRYLESHYMFRVYHNFKQRV